MGACFADSGWLEPFCVGGVVEWAIHGIFSGKSFGGVTNCKEFMTPGSVSDPVSEKDFSFGSTFHNRIDPSQEPTTH